MKFVRQSLLIVACLAIVACTTTPDFEPTPVQSNQPQPDDIYAKIMKIDGSVDEVLLELPDASFPGVHMYPTACVDMILPEGTHITTGDATVILGVFGVRNGQPKIEAAISIRHTTETEIGPALVDGELKSTLTRMKIASGEVRVKVTDESPDYESSMKVGTLDGTAFVGDWVPCPDGTILGGPPSSSSTPPQTEPSNEKK